MPEKTTVEALRREAMGWLPLDRPAAQKAFEAFEYAVRDEALERAFCDVKALMLKMGVGGLVRGPVLDCIRALKEKP